MISVDTNVIVRIFIDDLNIKQVEAARNLVVKEKKVYLTQIVLIEMVWVFSRAYRMSKSQIINILQEIYVNAAFELDDKELFHQSLVIYQENNVDFSDCMILINSKAAAVKQVYTFDAKFARLKNVIKLT